ncbi:GNAT family N-acetyltransferase [Paenibacillus sp. FSL R7-0345]|uniref:GNAT family N-acetyltransferase n=1 Tax=Paenibacillus sp. FSL R7-0345 TaxID=2954535 RepID=UPI003159CD3D
MIELNAGKYALVLLPLDSVKINTLFARAVLEQKIAGKVYADDADDPRAFYIAHPYGMSLLFGESGNDAFNRALSDYIINKAKTRRAAEWLQADPAGEWSGIVDDILDDYNHSPGVIAAYLQDAHSTRVIQRNTRVNFVLDRPLFAAAKANAGRQDTRIARMTGEHFAALEQGVVPRFFWRDAAHFLSEGAGFVLVEDGEIAAAAFSSCVSRDQLEIGIETMQDHRAKGYASLVSAALIEYCLDHGLEPVWACRLENTGSYRLAQKLGFRPVLTLPYYCLAYEASNNQ